MFDQIHLICNAHLDPVWLWDREEGVAEAIATFQTAVRFCREKEGFIFNHNEAVLYQWVEQYDPETFAAIQQLVKEGKWHIMGGWYLQPDCNMPSGESFVRQILEGRCYFKEKFGVEPTTAINFDPFGHTRGLVQIMVQCGYDSYIVCRPGPSDFPVKEDAFLWKGYDGSELMVHRAANGYESGKGRVRDKIQRYLDNTTDRNPGMCLWGIGNHGGGPSKEDLETIDTMKEEGLPLVHSTPEGYFKALREERQDFEVVPRSMNHWAVGCYTSQIRIKQKHRRLESEYYSLEKMASHAAAIGAYPYPEKELGEARRALLFLEFHDILPGSSIKRVEEQSLRMADYGLELIARKKLDIFLSMTYGRIAPESPVTPLYIYNPHPYEVEDTFTFELAMASSVRDGFAQPVLVHNGTEIPVQREQEENMVPIQWRRRIAFHTTLKPCAMERLEFTTKTVDKQECPGSMVEEENALRFSTDRISVLVNRRTGLVDSYQVDGKEYLKPGSFLPVVVEDTHDAWGMLVQKFDVPAGNFHIRRDGRGVPDIRVIEDGCVRTVVECVFEYEKSLIVTRYKLPRFGTEIEVELELQFMENTKMVKLAVYPAISDYEFLGETAYGAEVFQRNGQEEVAQKWLAARNGESCLTLINDSTYGSSCDGAGVYQTLIRSCGYSAHPKPGREHVFHDRWIQGSDHIETTYHFYLNGGSAAERLEKVAREAQLRHERPMMAACFSGKCQNSRESFLHVTNQAIVCPAVKKAEQGDDWIIRLFNSTGEFQNCELQIGNANMSLEFAPYKIKTIRYRAADRCLAETTLLEDDRKDEKNERTGN